MSWWIPLMVLVAVVMVGAGVANVTLPLSAQQPASVDAPVWHLGDHWTWQWGSKQETDTVVGTSGGYVVRYEAGADTHLMHYNADFSSPDVHIGQFQFPLTVGKTWSYQIDGTINGRAVRWMIQRRVEAMESVTVPAGTFDTVRISGHHCNVTVNNCGDFMVWYAPKVGNLAKNTWSNDGHWSSDVRGTAEVLISYQLTNP